MPCATARERLILALDYPDAPAALRVLDQLDGQCLWVKVGLELYLTASQPLLTTLAQRGYNIFLDLKLHDIPNTVAGAIRSLAPSAASLLTVHAAGGPAMLSAAAQAAAAGGPRLLAVTVLTSMDAPQLLAIGVPADPAAQVLRLATIAAAAGINGMVCSAAELPTLRHSLGEGPLLVVPGIRPAGSPVGDQRRTATPAQAIKAGASMLVVGRPITQAAHPAAAFASLLAEIEGALPLPDLV